VFVFRTFETRVGRNYAIDPESSFMRNLTMRNLTVSGIVLDLSADGMEFLLLTAGLYSRQPSWAELSSG
jgi:hypothetical protein